MVHAVQLGKSGLARDSRPLAFARLSRTQALMQAPEISLILATGGPAMVRSAYSSGHPSVGVGECGASPNVCARMRTLPVPAHPARCSLCAGWLQGLSATDVVNLPSPLPQQARVTPLP